jgi:hypothetical protein
MCQHSSVEPHLAKPGHERWHHHRSPHPAGHKARLAPQMFDLWCRCPQGFRARGVPTSRSGLEPQARQWPDTTPAQKASTTLPSPLAGACGRSGRGSFRVGTDRTHSLKPAPRITPLSRGHGRASCVGVEAVSTTCCQRPALCGVGGAGSPFTSVARRCDRLS